MRISETKKALHSLCSLLYHDALNTIALNQLSQGGYSYHHQSAIILTATATFSNIPTEP